MKNIKYIILFLAIGLVACSEDFLDRPPIAEDTTQTFYANYENLDYTATAAYSVLCSFEVFDIMYSIAYQTASDDVECGGENINDAPFYQVLDRLTHNGDETRLVSMWAYPYKGIRFTNEVIGNAERIKEIEIEKSISEDAANEKIAIINQRVAEMKFLRAYYHFTLMQLYGGVPIVDKILSPEEYNNPKNSIAEVLHFVEQDLTEAIPYLKEKSKLGTEIGRATKGAARSLLAKAYLYESSYADNYAGDSRFEGCVAMYDSALKYAEEVITSTEYQLIGIEGERYPSWHAPEGGTVGGFRYMFSVDADNGDESIWSIQNEMDGAGWAFTRGNYYVIYSTIRKYLLDDGTESPNELGWSFNIPTEYMVKAFGNADERETNLNSELNIDETLDPRFSVTVGREGDSVQVPEGDAGVWRLMSFSNIPAGAISKKYMCSTEEFNFGAGDSFGEGPMNVRLIRYGDVVLMAAEAAFKSGNTPLALNYVNLVRQRARNSGETGYPEALSTLSFEDIVHERRLELAMEQSRFFDLVRWGLASKYINGIKLASWGDINVKFVEGKHEFFPIPNSEVQRSTGLKQYDAWN